MITQMYNKTSISRFHGLSTDTKPTSCPNGSKFYEIDTGKTYLFDAQNSAWRVFSEIANIEADVTALQAEMLSKADLVNGVIPLSEIPPAVIERLVPVQDDAARFALTTDTVQNGDTVKVVSTNKMYLVVDDEHLDTEAGYQVYVAGRAAEAVADQNGNTIDTTYATLTALEPISESAYEALVVKDKPLYFIYDDSI